MNGLTHNNLMFHMTRAHAPEDRPQLLRGLLESLNIEEFENLCYRLQVNCEELPGDTKSEKTRALMEYCDRHQLGPQLAKASVYFFL